MSEIFDNGIYMVKRKDVCQKWGCESEADMIRLINKIDALTYQPTGNAFKQLQEWRKIGKQVGAIIETCYELNMASENQIKRLNDKTGERANKRWDEKEDEDLINLICDHDASIIEISSILGRSPTAIQNRVSHLVGIKRVSQEVAGKFIGTLNGANIEGNIRGQLVKQN